jgi:hypothetical protein
VDIEIGNCNGKNWRAVFIILNNYLVNETFIRPNMALYLIIVIPKLKTWPHPLRSGSQRFFSQTKTHKHIVLFILLHALVC